MTYENFIDTISENVAKDLSDNLENILRSLINGLPESASLTEEQLILAKNAVATSVQLSVRIMFSYLDSLGILNHQNLSKHSEPPDLKVLDGGLSGKSTD